MATFFSEILNKECCVDFINIIIAECVTLPRNTFINIPESLMEEFDAIEHYWLAYVRSGVV